MNYLVFCDVIYILRGFSGIYEVNLIEMILVLQNLPTNGRKIYRANMYFRSTSSNIVIFYIDLNYYVKDRINSYINKKVMGATKIFSFGTHHKPVLNEKTIAKSDEKRILTKKERLETMLLRLTVWRWAQGGVLCVISLLLLLI